jgi:hypothetical protein
MVIWYMEWSDSSNLANRLEIEIEIEIEVENRPVCENISSLREYQPAPVRCLLAPSWRDEVKVQNDLIG